MCITEKSCSRCKTIKPVSEFGKSNHSPDGLNYWCKFCKSETRKAHYLKNKEKVLESNRAWREANPERIKQAKTAWKEKNKDYYSQYCKDYNNKNKQKQTDYQKQWYAVNKEKKNGQSKEWYTANKVRRRELDREWRKNNLITLRQYLAAYRENNREKINSYSSNYRANKNGATPLWLCSNDFEEISELYRAAQLFKEYTGLEYHVDHIVPLNSDIVCGLHVPWNLRVIPAKENLSKQNRYWPDMP
jgi:hypothetical protein